jgi:hypothetical protein
MLNVDAGISLQGYSWPRTSHSDGKLRDVTIRNVYVQLSGPGRAIAISNVVKRHDIRVERSTFITDGGRGWLTGAFGRVWSDDLTSGPGGPMEGVWLVDNVITSNGRYGVTAPDGAHFGRGLANFVTADLQMAGNIIGDAPADQLENYNKHTSGGEANASVPTDELHARLTSAYCGQWSPDKGADCSRLVPIFELRKLLPEP